MEPKNKKRLFVCCDGTWNRPSQRELGLLAPTNVLKFANAIMRGSMDGGVEQLIYYHPGVGTGGLFDQILGGAFGVGLRRNIKSAYKWLCDQYRKDDDIFVVGFSRGAFTARSLIGMISHCGLIPQASWPQVEEAFSYYQQRKTESTDRAGSQRFAEFHDKKVNGATPIRPPVEFLGVWDTVGSLGLPQGGGLCVHILEKLMPKLSNRFHNMSLSDIVKCARHAIAIDEQRQPFNASLWHSEPVPGQSIEQVWFPGVHSDVGGGYIESGLSQIALLWMIQEAKSRGAVFRPHMVEQISASGFQAPMHDTLNELYSLIGSRPRSIPALVAPGAVPPAKFGQRPHESVVARVEKPPIADAPYRATVLLEPAQKRRFPAYARSYWNAPGIFVRQNQCYEVSATGEWENNDKPCGPDGAWPGLFRWFYGTLRRAPEANWFSLLATIGNAESPGNSNELTYLPTYRVGASAILRPEADGYVYFYTNDMMGLYGNNRGSVRVTMRRLPDNHSPPSEPMIGRRLLNAWGFAGRWVLSTATLAAVLYVALTLMLWGLVKPFGVNLADLYSWRGLVAGYGAFLALMTSVVGAYSWFYGRSDTRVEFVETEVV
ncbi:MAG TPA: DUF2235 domain-containing protein [Burkholderiales bacterium]|nr:DUF2235 domain-containing protein [Burkholderiales bacterium]